MAEIIHISKALQIDVTALRARSTESLPGTIRRLTDSELMEMEAVAAAPLPTLPPCDSHHFTQCIRIMVSALPRQGSDDMSGELFVAAYRRKLGHLPADAINYMTDKALERCKWFPPISECLSIAEGWQRDDEAARSKAVAIAAVGREKQARMNEAMDAMRDGVMTQPELDGLPERWRSIGETRGYLRRIREGEYVLRVMPVASEGNVL